MKGDGITAVVVSHFSEETIGACLSRLLASEGVSQVRVIDNASTDGTMEITGVDGQTAMLKRAL